MPEEFADMSVRQVDSVTQTAEKRERAVRTT